ncbi:MAG TPA: DUF72 domain-containing protein [Gemmatimonadota bacterium]
MPQKIGSCEVSFGIAGWSYPDWEGVVYPPGTRDKLRWLAGFVDLIEVNASFYAFLTPANAEDWLARTADLPDFRFAAKANRVFTHEREDAAGPPEAHATRAFLEPLRRSERLAALLFQFPFSFRDGAEARHRLERIADAFRGLPLVAEVRHASWQTPEALGFLGETGFSVANIDLPTGSQGFAERLAKTGEPGYLRLHGRNAAEWFRTDAGRDARYDYLYGDEELEELAERIEELARRFRQLVIVTNNHYRGQALANLAELAVRTGGPRWPLPAPLLATYPRLAAVGYAVSPPPQGKPERKASGGEEGKAAAVGGGTHRRAAAPASAQGDLFESRDPGPSSAPHAEGSG